MDKVTFKTYKCNGVSIVTIDGQPFRFYDRAKAFAFIALHQLGYKM